ncbi:MAG: type I restriction-modification system subunit M [Verrucomicrobiales bacterium]|nr:type I restriction-modification system subunit M [Verrucomicrobiales bacterium]
MHWTEPADTDDTSAELERRLWATANTLWADADLKPSEYSPIVLGIIFLRYADAKFAAVEKEMAPAEGSRRRRKIGPADYHAAGVLFVPDEARFRSILELPEGESIGESLNAAMRGIERENPDLADVLPKTYHILDNRTLKSLLKDIASIPMEKDGDVFGKIYEYFLGKFAMSEGQKGGEFFTPTSMVKLIVEILEPYHGRILDPACGSGGMFVQSAKFVANHKLSGPLTPNPSPRGRGGEYSGNPTSELSVYGQEKTSATAKLARLNLTVHGLSGDIKQANTFYEDLHDCVPSGSSPSGRGGGEGAQHGRFDFVMANPPFNVSKVDKERIADDPRYPFGLPRTDNANYLWIQLFYASLNDGGRAGFVMANSAADARSSEQDIRQKLIETGAVDVMVACGSNFFYTVTLPATLWFFDKGKVGSDRVDSVLFIDARHIYRQIDRAHRDFTPAQIEFIANIVRLYRGESPEFTHGSEEKLKEVFSPQSSSPSGRGGGEGDPKTSYEDVLGLCKSATRAEIEQQGWSLNPGRYVGVAKGEEISDEDFKEKLIALNEELEVLNNEAHELEEVIANNVLEMLEV